MKSLKVMFFLLLMSTSTIFISGCSKEEETDVRDNIVGTYNYKLKFYKVEGTNLTYTGSENDNSGSIIVKNNADNSTSIDFFENGKLVLQGTKVASATNGIVFDITTQTTTEDGLTMTINGYNYWELGGTKYHGAYVTANKTIGIAFQTVIDGVSLVFVFEGTKN